VIEEIRPGLKPWVGPHPEFDPRNAIRLFQVAVASVLFHGEDALAHALA
jgi:hypothetical protein